jgi:long-subunit fatty acid transport protein
MRGSHRSFRHLGFNVGAAALALVAAPAAANAGGLFIPGQGPIAQSRAGAYVANAEDPSAMAVNPAGLAKGDGVRVLVGVNFIDYDLSFTRNGNYDATPDADLSWEGQAYEEQSDASKPPIGFAGFQAVPMIVVAFDLSKQVKGLHVAVGLAAPSAYPVRDFSDDDWTINEDDADRPPPPTRYDIIKQEAAVVMPSLSVGYRIMDKLDVGGRFTWGIANLKASTFTWRATNFEEWTGKDAFFSVETKDNFVPGFGIGALYRPTDNIEVGLNWDSQMNVHARGEGEGIPSNMSDPVVEIEPPPANRARCADGGEIGALKTCVDISLPMVTTVGGRYIFRDAEGVAKGDVELDVAWERWSAVSDYHVLVDGEAMTLPLNPTVIRHGLRDVFSFRLGGGYTLPVGDGLAVRAGLAHDTAAAKKGWERLDLDGAARTTMALGVSYPLSKVTISVGGGYVYEGSRDVGGGCNPTITAQGCDASQAGEEPQNQREGADPAQPLNAGLPFQSPFNHGRYESGYVLMHLAVVAKF